MTKNMTEGYPAKLIILFAIPLIVGNMFQQLYNVVDTMIVGRILGVNALAALGCTGSLCFFIMGFVMGFANGLSIITAQRFGAGDTKGVKVSFAASILLSVGLTLVMTLVAELFVRNALRFLQTPPEIIEEALAYVRVIFGGIICSVLFNLTSNMIRALGDSRTPLYFLAIACIMNIILDIVFITTFHMGVAGAGYATIISQLFSGVLCVIYIKKKLPILWVKREHFTEAPSVFLEHIKVALPMAFQMSIIAIGALILQYALNGLGSNSVAAYAAAQKIDSLATFPLNSLGAAMATFAAQNYGAGKYDRIRQGVFHAVIMTIILSILLGLMNIFFGNKLTELFVDKSATEVITLSKNMLFMNGCLYTLLGLLFVYRFTLQGLGNGLIPTIGGIIELLIRAFAAFILAKQFGFMGAVAANPLAWFGSFAPHCIAYYITVRKLK